MLLCTVVRCDEDGHSVPYIVVAGGIRALAVWTAVRALANSADVDHEQARCE